MAVFQVDVEKRIGTEYWSNVWYVNADTMVTATTAGLRIAEMERRFHKQTVVFTQCRVRTQVAGDEIFTNTPIGAVGAVASSPADELPLWNVARVDYGAVTGRPSRKYYRLPLLESEVTNKQVIESVRTLIAAQWNEMISDIGPSGATHVDVDGQLITSVVPQILVGMRQLRRGTRRRTQPIL